MILNYGCGDTKLTGYINIDIEESLKPDLVHDLRKAPLPYEKNSVESILCSHNIEHIEMKFWPQFFSEFWRVLQPDGFLILSYPEFSKCAQNFIENKYGMKEFWRATLYGRQLYPGDYHVVPMVTEDLLFILKDFGFYKITHKPEVNQEFNTFLVAKKDATHKRLRTQEDLIREEVFNLYV